MSNWSKRGGGLHRTRKDVRSAKRTIIVCYDGEKTEAEYFRGWRRVLGTVGIVLQPYFIQSGGSVLAAVESALVIMTRERDHEEFWCVCDVDDSSIANITAGVTKAKANGISLCLSNRCFEIWLACHWGKISTAEIATEKEACALVAAHHKTYSSRNKVVPFDVLFPLTDDALLNGDWLEKRQISNPSTSLHKLVQKFSDLLR